MGVFDSPEAQNWLRQWLAVFITRKAILPAVKSKAVQLHTALLTLATLAATVCPQDHKRITDTSVLSCRFHDKFRDEIKHRHKQRPSWKNATTDTWHNDAFSIAKLFMQPSGYDDKTNFDQIDFNGIAAFMFNCGCFPTSVESSSDQARISTNMIRHLPDMCSSALTDQATTDCIDNFATLLNDQIFCGEKDVQEALKQLDMIHMAKNTGDKPYSCDLCDADFPRKKDLQTHIRVHTGEKPYKCEICNAAFSQNNNLQNHVRIHTGVKPFKCEICDAAFTQQSTLKAHIRIHTGEKPYMCELCDAAFSRKHHLQTHIRIHTGEKPYKCGLCDVDFTRKSDLKAHTRMHTGEKPYKCGICDVDFSRKKYLQAHIRKHTVEKP